MILKAFKLCSNAHIYLRKQTSKNTHHIYKAADVRIHVEIH